jgi:hypothetical protein
MESRILFDATVYRVTLLAADGPETVGYHS